MNIIKMLSNNTNHYGRNNKKQFITVHETGNTGNGANAKSHANYINNGSKSTWHFTVDSNNIYQHFTEETQCWHCGDGRGNGNLNSIGIEMCINSDGDINKTISRTVKLIQHLMSKHKIPLTNVVQHNNWSGKNCPANVRAGKPINWYEFHNLIKVSNTPTVNKPKDDGTLYRVQVGAFNNKANADRLIVELKSKGYSPIISRIVR